MWSGQFGENAYNENREVEFQVSTKIAPFLIGILSTFSLFVVFVTYCELILESLARMAPWVLWLDHTGISLHLRICASDHFAQSKPEAYTHWVYTRAAASIRVDRYKEWRPCCFHNKMRNMGCYHGILFIMVGAVWLRASSRLLKCIRSKY